MADIRHRVGIAAPQEQVYEALSTVEGLSQWWTREVDGDATGGGALRFFFGRPEPGAVMEVDETTPADRVVWRCVEGPDDWVGTKLVFDLKAADGETILLFAHEDWSEPTEFMSHCSTKWGYFLLGLKSGLEGGDATPYPGEVKISSWG
jgi:uncharacterized protein YndB with AHSA1/START domain